MVNPKGEVDVWVNVSPWVLPLSLQSWRLHPWSFNFGLVCFLFVRDVSLGHEPWKMLQSVCPMPATKFISATHLAKRWLLTFWFFLSFFFFTLLMFSVQHADFRFVLHSSLLLFMLYLDVIYFFSSSFSKVCAKLHYLIFVFCWEQITVFIIFLLKVKLKMSQKAGSMKKCIFVFSRKCPISIAELFLYRWVGSRSPSLKKNCAGGWYWLCKTKCC
jgi:hypothetical protein